MKFNFWKADKYDSKMVDAPKIVKPKRSIFGFLFKQWLFWVILIGIVGVFIMPVMNSGVVNNQLSSVEQGAQSQQSQAQNDVNFTMDSITGIVSKSLVAWMDIIILFILVGLFIKLTDKL
jgi:ATP-dependent Zn protease